MSVLGVYIDFCANKISNVAENYGSTSESGTAQESVFTMMMNATRTQFFLPDRKIEVDKLGKKLSKNKLFNDILDILKSSAVEWSKDDVNDRGSSLVDKITDCLWYLDRHHHTLAAQGFPVPKEFEHFQGYNIPDKHGHKPSVNNLEQSRVLEHSLKLLEKTQQSYMKRNSWTPIREILLQLAVNLRKYSDYLVQSNKKTKMAQSSMFASTAADNSSIITIEPKISTKPTIIARYKRLNDAIHVTNNLTPIFMNDFLSPGKWQRSK